MRTIHKAPEIVWRSVDPRGCEPLHSVISPAEPSGELGDGHHFQNGDTGFGQMRQFGLGAGPGAWLGERTNVHLVNHLMRKSHAAPILVGPAEGGGIDHFRPPVRALGLESRRGIRTGFATSQLKFVTRAGSRVWPKARKIA